MSRNDYEEQKRLLQIELLKLQKWSQANGLRHDIVFEAATRQARVAPSSASWSTCPR
jgi:polyphosphate kinase 2 (PPK2 family)